MKKFEFECDGWKIVFHADDTDCAWTLTSCWQNGENVAPSQTPSAIKDAAWEAAEKAF